MDVSINNNSNRQLTFGWSCKTHKKMIQHVLKEFPEFHEYRDIFKAYVQKPDYDELGQMGNWHFYSPDSKRSYLDYSGKNNALARYKLHTKNMYEYLENGETEDAMKESARMLHLGHDMSQPHHTLKGWFFNKVWDCKIHLRFEKSVEKSQDVYLKDYQKIKKIAAESNPASTNPDTKLEAKDFTDLFMNSVHLSMKNKIPTSKNSSTEWESIGQKGLNQAMDFTSAFMTKLSALASKHQNNDTLKISQL